MAYVPDELMTTTLAWLDAYCSRDFTKRQTQILAFLLTLTFRKGAIICHIPKLSDFEQCGISRTKIKDELRKLVDLQVVHWDEEKMNFYINPETEQWKAPPFKTFEKNKYKVLIDVNSPQEG